MSNDASAAAQTHNPEPEPREMSAPAGNPNARVFRGTWTSVEQLNEDTFVYRARLELGAGEILSFAPGQFAQIYRDADPKQRSRAYSIASSPEQLPDIEFCIKLYPKGMLAEYLRTVRPGMPIVLKAPFGRFTLRGPAVGANSPSVFVVTGTGIAPVRPMVQELLLSDPTVNATLIQGHRSERGIFFRDEFAALAKQHANFTYVPTISPRYVTQVLREHKFESSTNFYLCGNPAMVREASVQLVERGVPIKQIAVEKW